MVITGNLVCEYLHTCTQIPSERENYLLSSVVVTVATGS